MIKMKNKHSKTKNFLIYRYLLKYKTSELAYEKSKILASHLNEHRNKIISCIAQAQKNFRIYKELIDFGYSEKQIPSWFLRPDEKVPQKHFLEIVEIDPPQNQGFANKLPIIKAITAK